MLDFRQSLINGTLRKVLKRLHYPLEVMLTCVRWYVAYPLSLRHVEEMMQERGARIGMLDDAEMPCYYPFRENVFSQ
jgi:hypothetical protein